MHSVIGAAMLACHNIVYTQRAF